MGWQLGYAQKASSLLRTIIRMVATWSMPRQWPLLSGVKIIVGGDHPRGLRSPRRLPKAPGKVNVQSLYFPLILEFRAEDREPCCGQPLEGGLESGLEKGADTLGTA